MKAVTKVAVAAVAVGAIAAIAASRRPEDVVYLDDWYLQEYAVRTSAVEVESDPQGQGKRSKTVISYVPIDRPAKVKLGTIVTGPNPVALRYSWSKFQVRMVIFMTKRSPRRMIPKDLYQLRQIFPESNHDRPRLVVLLLAIAVGVVLAAVFAGKAHAAIGSESANGKTIVVNLRVSNPSTFQIAGTSTSAYKVFWTVKVPGKKAVSGQTPAQRLVIHVVYQKKALRQMFLNAASAKLTVRFVPTQPSAGHHLNATVCFNFIRCKAVHT